MALSAPQRWEDAQQIEKDLSTLIRCSKPTYEEIENLIHQMRILCEEIIFLDFGFAAKSCIGRHLWDAHTLINNRYRKIIGRYKGDKNFVVEKRKVEKHYVDFIKTSQYFYKGYIQRLASHFSGIKGLSRIAGILCINEQTTDSLPIVPAELQKLIEQSCYATLLRLGDLSRYRNMIKTRERSWQPAVGYYQLANSLDPLSGTAHNKMAVIALADNNHLDAVYHLFRATAAYEPDLLAPGNLEIEFKKILSARFSANNNQMESLIWWFILLQANLNEGVEFATLEEMQKEVLSRFTSYLKEEPCGDLIQKLVLISIAAHYNAHRRLEDQGAQNPPESTRIFRHHTNFNVRLMSQLLSIITPEIDDSLMDENSPTKFDEKQKDLRTKSLVVFRRILPFLRYYTLWFATNEPHIRPNTSNEFSNSHNKELWSAYALFLTKLVNCYPVKEMTTVPYLLTEDSTTVGFMPFRNPELVKALDFYKQVDGNLKPYIGDHGVKRSDPDIEMQSRILDIVCCGIQLQMKNDIPLQLHNRSDRSFFSFVGDDSPLPLASAALSRNEESCIDQIKRKPNDSMTTQLSADERCEIFPSTTTESLDVQDSVELSLSRMVDQLLEPASNMTLENIKTPITKGCVNNDIRTSVMSHSTNLRFQGTPKLLPSLPGIFSSAFTPQPNELLPINSCNQNTSYQLSPLSLVGRDSRYKPTALTEEQAGYTYLSDSSQRRLPRPTETWSKGFNYQQQSLTPISPESTEYRCNYSSSSPLDQVRANTSKLSKGKPNISVGNSFDYYTMLQNSIQSTVPLCSYIHNPHGNQGD